MSENKMKTAVVGCGQISDIYLTNMMKRFHTLEVTACCAAHLESAQKKAAEYGIKACSYEEILEDATIEMVVILTPAPTHYELIKKALLHGKHVFTEKTMTLDLKEAKELANLADQQEIYLGCAPETFLGDSLQTAKRVIEEGLIGEVTSFHMCANRDYDYLTSQVGFLRMPGGGICYDYSVYYLTALVYLLGSVKSVYAEVDNYKPIRKNILTNSPEYGKCFESPNESIAAAVLRMKSGVMGTCVMNAESNRDDRADFRIYGTKGILILSDPNQFGGEIRFIQNETLQRTGNIQDYSEEKRLEQCSRFSDNCRGIGPSEMAVAIRSRRPCMTDKEMAVHVLDIIDKIIRSGKTGRREFLETNMKKKNLVQNMSIF